VALYYPSSSLFRIICLCFSGQKYTKADILNEVNRLLEDGEEVLKLRVQKSEGGRDALRESVQTTQDLENLHAATRESKWITRTSGRSLEKDPRLANGSGKRESGKRELCSDVSMGGVPYVTPDRPHLHRELSAHLHDPASRDSHPMRGHTFVAVPLSDEQRRLCQHYGGFFAQALPRLFFW